MTRFWTASVALSPALVLVCLAWLWAHVGIALVVTVLSLFGSGYAARWLDEPAKHSVRRSIFP